MKLSRLFAAGILLVMGSLPLGAQDHTILASVGMELAEAQATAFLERPAGVEAEAVSLADVLHTLRSRSGVPITFSPSLLPSEPTVTCKCREHTVREALDQVLDGTDFSWESVGKQVVVEPNIPDTGTGNGSAPIFHASLPGAGTLSAASLRRPLPRARTAREGTIQGQVTHGRTSQPLPAAQVYVDGTQLGTITDSGGNYSISGVPAGEVTVSVQLIGFATASSDITVASGETVTLDFQLSERALDLDGIVVTGTAGGTQRRAIGNVVATVDAEEIMTRSPIGNVDQLVGQRTPGAMMLPGTGQVGTGSAVRIRGNSSLSLANEPIIYIDGVRMDSDPRRGPGQRGGANVSRLNDVHPGDIESIEIIKGPAAATLYGTEASNGVIQIITKRGASGTPQFDVTTRIGTNWLWNPAGRTGNRYMPDPNNPGQLIGLNVYEHERDHGLGDPFGYGRLQSVNVSMRGGTDQVRYFASVSRDDDTGIVSHNWSERTAVRANMEILLTDDLTVTVGSSYITGDTRLAQGAINPDPFSNLIWSNPRNLDDRRRGWRQAPPETWDEVTTRADNDRTTTNVEMRYQPVSWSTHRLVAGLDSNAEVNWTLYPQHPDGADHVYGSQSLGQKSVERGTRSFVTVDYSGSANFSLSDYDFESAVGFQYYKSESSFINSFGAEFPAVPITTVSGGAVRDGGETFVENSTVGVYVQQQVGWHNRRFLTAAVRADDNSAFGVEFDAAIYPKLSATWVLHEEEFWQWDWVEQLRLRGAFGAAGQQPGTFDASRLYDPVIGYRDRPALLPSAFGNPQLQPERGEELEIGFDASFLDGRLDVEFTRYQRTVKDAIVNSPLAPSSGFTGSQIVNIGLLEAWGNELGVSARLMESPRFAWEIDTQLSSMNNEIKDLGGLEAIGAPGQAFHREGYSIGDFFMREFLEVEIDENGQVLSALCDGGAGPQGVDVGGSPVPCGEAPQVWMGHSQPTWQIGFGNSFTLFENLTLYARVEGNGGHHHTNTEIRATHNQATTRDVLMGDNPFLQAVRIFENDRTSLYKAGFLRLRELSATYRLPDGMAQRLRARNGSVSLGMRNVAMLWTAEHGWSTPRDGSVQERLAGMTTWDPEVRSTGQSATGYQTVLPPTASATLTVRLGF